MSRRRADRTGDRSRNRPGRASSQSLVRIDVDVFETIASTEGLDECGGRPRIERWLDCWGDP